MTTAILRIEAETGGGYPIKLFSDHGANAKWLEQPLATGVIPKSVLEAPLQGDPPENWNAARVRAVLLNKPGVGDDFAQIGSWLYALLAGDVIGPKWVDLRNQVGADLRTVLDIEPRELRLLPWELAFHELAPLFLQAPLLRGKIEKAAGAWTETWPLRVLVVVGGDIDDKIRAEEELDGIEDALHSLGPQVVLEILSRPTRKKLQAELAKFAPHIFHFIGHGATGKQHGWLSFYADTNDAWDWKVGEIDTDLNPAQPPRLAFLNACHSADPTAQENAWSVTDAFLKRCRAAMGMMADINGAAAALFARTFYEKIAEEKTIDAALLAARKQVEIGYPQRREWCLGCLEMHGPIDDVLRPAAPAREERKNLVATFKIMRDFVGRRPDRRAIWEGYDPIQGDAPGRLLMIVGGDDVGKTQLVRSCVAASALRGRNVVYPEFDGQLSINFLALLRAIRDQVKTVAPVYGGRLKPDTFAKFDHVLAHALEGQPAPNGPPFMRDSKKITWTGGDDGLAQDVFDAFNAALASATGEVPLVLVLDHVNMLPSEFQQFVLRYFITPLTQGQVGNVRLILVLRDRDFVDFKLGDLGTPHFVSGFKKSDYVPFVRAYGRRLGWRVKEKEAAIQILAGLISDGWKPETLPGLEQYLK